MTGSDNQGLRVTYDQQEQQLAKIEQTQAALRDNIAESQRLIDKSQELISAHRRELSDGAPAD